MARYVDGFLIPVPKKNLAAYARMSKKAGKVWMDHGALEYRETAGDDLKTKGMTSFVKSARAKAGEVPVFSWIVYRSKAHRDAVNKKVMNDPRIARMMENSDMPFDPKKMAYGGFRVIVDL
jgi:uncharacterized protein YbaA (DUF1428 family)